MSSSVLPLDGISLVPLLTGDPVDWPDRMLFSHWKGRGAVRTEQYRLVVEPGRHTLFDMQAGPGQSTGIAKSHPDVAAKLRAAVRAKPGLQVCRPVGPDWTGAEARWAKFNRMRTTIL
ncbi:MAG: hypothetical protein KJ060_08985 [Candidatus Hydrogenedentes bacterium]|nr:hypothetical protein [Candidatus Hydrogenedentota bacterium]